MKDLIDKVLSALEKVRLELRCSVCLSLLKMPCSLPCNHFFCEDCVERALQASKSTAGCPLCKHKFSRRTIQFDKQLLSLVQRFRSIYEHASISLGAQELSQQPDPEFVRREIERNRRIQHSFAAKLQLDLDLGFAHDIANNIGNVEGSTQMTALEDQEEGEEEDYDMLFREMDVDIPSSSSSSNGSHNSNSNGYSKDKDAERECISSTPPTQLRLQLEECNGKDGNSEITMEEELEEEQEQEQESDNCNNISNNRNSNSNSNRKRNSKKREYSELQVNVQTPFLSPTQQQPIPEEEDQDKDSDTDTDTEYAQDGVEICLWSPYKDLPLTLTNTNTSNRCSVCLQSSSPQFLFQCSKCQLSVHSDCYGIPTPTPTPTPNTFLCDPCSSPIEIEIEIETSASPHRCILCPNTQDNSLKQTTEGDWIHVNCALWHSGPSFAPGGGILGPVANVSLIPSERYRLVCIFCKTRKGACLQCCFPRCGKSFHACCAIWGGCRFELRIAPDKGQDTMYFHQYCHEHAGSSLLVPSNNHDRTGKAGKAGKGSKKRKTSTSTSTSSTRAGININKRGVIVCTSLNSEQMAKVNRFSTRYGYSLEKEYSGKTTHIVTPATISNSNSNSNSNNSSKKYLLQKRTVKFIKGLIGNCWIVSFQWIERALDVNEDVSCDPFQVQRDPYAEILPRAERKASKVYRKLFKDCLFFFAQVFSEEMANSDLQFIVSKCGGKVCKFRTVKGVLKTLARVECRRVFIITFSDQDKENGGIGKELESIGASIPPKWIFDCISHCRILDDKI